MCSTPCRQTVALLVFKNYETFSSQQLTTSGRPAPRDYRGDLRVGRRRSGYADPFRLLCQGQLGRGSVRRGQHRRRLLYQVRGVVQLHVGQQTHVPISDGIFADIAVSCSEATPYRRRRPAPANKISAPMAKNICIRATTVGCSAGRRIGGSDDHQVVFSQPSAVLRHDVLGPGSEENNFCACNAHNPRVVSVEHSEQLKGTSHAIQQSTNRTNTSPAINRTVRLQRFVLIEQLQLSGRNENFAKGLQAILFAAKTYDAGWC